MIIQSSKVFVEGDFVKAQVCIEGGKISAVLPYNAKTADVEYGDFMVLPGFIDVHTHGGYGCSVNDASEGELVSWCRKLPGEGVTSALPTTSTATNEATIAALSRIACVEADERSSSLQNDNSQTCRGELCSPGAQILGIHLEGPFLDREYRGAHNESLLQAPNIALFEQFQKAARGNIKYITIAPEHDKGFTLIKHASQNGVKVAIGHSSASGELTKSALLNGATSFAHSFNAMRPLHHREPGVVGALMASNSFAEIVADGHHVNPDVINILFKAKEYSKLILVTDSMMVKGLPPGLYNSGGMDIEMDESGLVKLQGTNTLAGSSLKMNEGVRLLVEQAMIPLNYAILSATLNPAQMLGIEMKKGQVLASADADITVLDNGFNVVQTYCLGRAML